MTRKGDRFVYHHIGLEVELIRNSDAQQLLSGGYVRDGVRTILDPRDHDVEYPPEDEMAGEGLARRRERFHTGNHEPRNHSVRVPTRAGQPVRG